MKFLAALIFVFVSLTAFGQIKNVKFKTGQTFDPKGTVNEIIGKSGDKVYYTSYKRGYYLGAVNSESLSQIFEIEIQLPEYLGKETDFYRIVLIKDELILFTTQYNGEKKKFYTLAGKLKETGVVDGKPVLIEETESPNKRSTGNLNIEVNSELNRILIHTDMPMGKYGQDKLVLKMLDNDLKTIWEGNLILPYPDRYFAVNDYLIDKADNIYMVCGFDEYAKTKAEEGRKKAKDDMKERGGNNLTYKVLVYNTKTSHMEDYEIEIDKFKTILSFSYGLASDDNLNIVGLYANDKKADGADGVYFIKLNGKTGSVISSSVKEFDKGMVQEYLIATMGEKRGTKSAERGTGITNFKVRELIEREDGGLLVSGEVYYSYTVCTTDPRTGATRCSTHYIFGYIIVINISPTGEVEWVRHVKKYQHTVNDGGFYSSYGLMVAGEKLYYIFNDNIKNYNPKKKPNKYYPMAGVKGSVTTIAIMDGDGKVLMEPNNQLRVDKKILRPKVSYTVSGDNKIIMLAKWGKNECFVEVSLNK